MVTDQTQKTCREQQKMSCVKIIANGRGCPVVTVEQIKNNEK